MYRNQKVVVVLPAYNSAKTLERTWNDIPHDVVDEVILVDDASRDSTIEKAVELGIGYVLQHKRNQGYGGNQKTCYEFALSLDADIIIMVHPDYQYDPRLIESMISIIGKGVYPVVFGSRILGNGALKGGMPLYKYVANRGLTAVQNLLMGQKLSEYHTGYRAYSASVLRSIPFAGNSNDFIFDNQLIAQVFAAGYEIGEVTCPTRYFEEASSINFARSVKYGLGVLHVSFRYFLHQIRLQTFPLLVPEQNREAPVPDFRLIKTGWTA